MEQVCSRQLYRVYYLVKTRVDWYVRSLCRLYIAGDHGDRSDTAVNHTADQGSL